ncbi:prephenate dehydrogenase/arogenate dehydrogenase family protein [Marinomonas epiphytica]
MKKFGNVMIVGLGMIGGSFAKSLKDQGLATLYGVDRREGELALGVANGVIDYPAELTAEFVEKMDVIFLATPVRAMESVLEVLKPLLKATTLLTDAGSTKGSVVQAAVRVFGALPDNFIPGHPIAGAEKSGVLAANPHLFEQHMAIVTPSSESDPVLLDRLHRLWQAVGADVVSMDVEHHDHVLASSSHLPHLLAYTLVDALANSSRSQDVFKFAAGGFRDFTRIASSDPVMWRDVFLANKDATLATLDQFTDRLQVMRKAIEEGDGASMFGVFTRAKSARDHFLRLLEQRTGARSTKDPKQINLAVSPATSIKGEVSLPGDRFLSHKAITMAALSEGNTLLSNINIAGNVRITIQALRDMGVVIDEMSANQLRIRGVGKTGLREPIAAINVHDSVETLYVLLPVLAGQNFSVAVCGDDALSTTPFTDLLGLLKGMGAQVESADADCLPVFIRSNSFEVLEVSPSARSEKMTTATLLAANFAQSSYCIPDNMPGLSADLGLFAHFGINIVGRMFNPGSWLANDVDLPADADLLAFFSLLATLSPGSNLLVKNACSAFSESTFNEFLHYAGVPLTVQSAQYKAGGSGMKVAFSPLKGFVLSAEQTARWCKYLPFICVAAAYAKGESRIKGIRNLSYVYEDRVQDLVDALKHMKIKCSYEQDTLIVCGGLPEGGDLDCAGDIYVGLAMLAVGVRSREVTLVRDCQALLEEFNELTNRSEELGFRCAPAQ